MATLEDRRSLFRSLHESGSFIIPNPWDAGSARYLTQLGFKALATTSGGFAFSKGLPDKAVPRDRVLAHIVEIVRATELPVSADFESGYADEPEQVGVNVCACVATGVAGLSIEDATSNAAAPLYDFALAVERIRAARQAIDHSAENVLLTARAECYLVGHPEPLKESIRRLEAYAEAGADVLYAPGARTRADIAELVRAVSPKPLNVLLGPSMDVDVAGLTELGVRRISVGSALARAAWGGFIRAATTLARSGSLAGLTGVAPGTELNRLFASYR